jgi:3-phytase
MRYLCSLIIVLIICLPSLASQPQCTIPGKTFTASTGNDVDDCAIWVHPTAPEKSLGIINDKGPAEEYAGLYIYTLNGKLLQKVLLHQPQNPDIRYNVIFGKDTMDVLVCTDRESGNSAYNKIRVFRINPSKAEAADGFLTEITTAGGIPTGQNNAYGHSLYRRPSDGALYSITSNYNKADFSQIHLESDGAGKVKGTIVRKWGRTDIKGDICEGICSDDDLGYIYICDEDVQILKYYADPDKNNNSVVSTFALDDGIKSDREGINIYRCDNTSGYILLSSQGNDEIKVYDRQTNEFKGTVIPDGMKDCDGLDVTAVPLGSQYPHGMTAIHLGSTAGSQFGFYDWSDIATGLKLATPCDAKRPIPALLTTIIKLHTPINTTNEKPRFYYDHQRILLKNIPYSNSAITAALFDEQGKQILSKNSGIMRDGEVEIVLTGYKLHTGIYILKCNANAHSFCAGMLTVE